MEKTEPAAQLYVRMVDAIVCLAPVVAHQNPDGTYRVLATPDFDVEDTATLLEFLPGDDVCVTVRTLPNKPGPVLVATTLVRSLVEDRDYWCVLFSVASGESSPAVPGDRVHAIAARIKNEIESGTRWHYPSVIEWARSVG